jgi:quercetin dioxygenase-like cupin family protein
MKITSLDRVEKKKVDMAGAYKVSKQVPLSHKDGAPVYSYRVFTIEPDGYTPYHQHDSEHMNYIIEGHGVLVNENGEEQEIKKGDFALVLPNEKHQYRNRSKDKPMVIICGVPKEFE